MCSTVPLRNAIPHRLSPRIRRAKRVAGQSPPPLRTMRPRPPTMRPRSHAMRPRRHTRLMRQRPDPPRPTRPIRLRPGPRRRIIRRRRHTVRRRRRSRMRRMHPRRGPRRCIILLQRRIRATHRSRRPGLRIRHPWMAAAASTEAAAGGHTPLAVRTLSFPIAFPIIIRAAEAVRPRASHMAKACRGPTPVAPAPLTSIAKSSEHICIRYLAPTELCRQIARSMEVARRRSLPRPHGR